MVWGLAAINMGMNLTDLPIHADNIVVTQVFCMLLNP